MSKASHAREAAMSRASEVRDRATSSPAALGVVGALAGSGLGMLLAKKAKERRREKAREEPHYIQAGGFRTDSSYVTRDYVAEPAYTPRAGGYPDYSTSPEVGSFGAESWSEPYRSAGAEEAWEHAGGQRDEPSRKAQFKDKGAEFKEKGTELKEKASHKAADLKHRFSDKKDDLLHKTDDLRHKMQDRSSSGGSHLKERMPSADELKQGARDRPMGVILGGMAIGALAASLLPLSRRERKAMHPAKEKARHQLEDQFSSIQHKFEERLTGEDDDEESRYGSEDREESGRDESRQGRGEERDRDREESSPSFDSGDSTGGDSFSSSESRESRESSGSYASATSSDDRFSSSSEMTSREDLGSRSDEEEPYRQPSFAEQLENKDKMH